jgi:hypothetical protein
MLILAMFALSLVGCRDTVVVGAAVRQHSESAVGVELRGSFSAADAAKSIVTQSSNVGLFAVSAASTSAGRLVTTGTFTQSGESWRYASEPTDRLILEFSNGQSIEYQFETIEGVDTSSAENFIASNHRLTYQVASAEYGTLRIDSARSGQNRQVEIDGTLRFDELRYTIDLALVSWDYFENDSSGMEYQDEYVVSGTVSGEDYQLTVDETWSFLLVSSVDSSSESTKTSSVSNATKIMNSRLQAGGVDYQWNNCRIQKAFRDGKPGEMDYWQGQGGLLRNGEQYGDCGWWETPYSVGFALYTAEGEIVLEEWMWDDNGD